MLVAEELKKIRVALYEGERCLQEKWRITFMCNELKKKNIKMKYWKVNCNKEGYNEIELTIIILYNW